jgi:hypothetical protein
VPASFVVFLAFIALWPLGVGAFFAMIAGFLRPKYRRYARRGSVWALVGGLALSVPLAVIGPAETGIAPLRIDFAMLVVKVFFAGFALGTLTWYVLRFRSVHRSSAV